MTVVKRISGMFRTRRQERPAKREEDGEITARFALAFQALDATASRASEIKEVANSLKDESQKLKDKLRSGA